MELKLRKRIAGFFGIIDFFVPIDVLTSVLVVFSLENLVDAYVGSASVGLNAWIVIAFVGLLLVNLAAIEPEEREELKEDLDEMMD